MSKSALSVPSGKAPDGVPTGLQIVGNPCDDKAVFRIAQALEVTTDYLLDESEEPSDQVLKEAFFRKFSKLKPEDQEKITDMIDLWSKKS